jgi:predicted ATPase
MPASAFESFAASQPARAPLLGGVWAVRLLGALEARNGDARLTHFVSQPIAALFARLALLPQRAHSREELVELLWPGVDLTVGRNRLRNGISSLRRLLEPPGVAAGSVLVADRQCVRFAPGASRCDAVEFEAAVRAGDAAAARAAYRGELLPGFYDDWVQDERQRLAALFERLAEAHDGTMAPPATSVPSSFPVGVALAHVDAWPLAGPVLPNWLTAFFGREAERAQLLALIAQQRLVILGGPGGSGKTRLAVEVARAASGFDCVAFVALADCTDANQSVAQLRVALQLPAQSEVTEPLDQVVLLLSDRRPLLVLDNFEQLVHTDAVVLVETLLARVPALHLLITSRRVPGLQGEHEFPLQPLPQPDPNCGLAQTAANPSVSLFVDRARLVRPDFQVTSRNHESLASLCRALEGLPLAIELAASRSRAFSPSDMHAALAQRFSLLTRGPARNGRGIARSDSLRGAIDWSWRLLQPQEQRFLCALSVFRGGWTATCAQSICDEPRACELLDRLTGDSLLRSEPDAGGSMRFFMLETIREYLREQLGDDKGRVLRRRHRAHFLAQGLSLGQRSQAAARDDLPNFVEALQSAVDDAEHGLALALAVALRGEWEQHGMPGQVRELIERALAQQAPFAAGLETLLVQARLLLRSVLLVAGKSEAAQGHVAAALALAGDRRGPRAAALLGQARQHWERSRAGDLARPLLEEALRLIRHEHDVETEAGIVGTLATVTFHQDDKPDEAIALFGQAQRLYESAGIEHLANRTLFKIANCHANRHRYELALELLAECERRFIASGHVAALPELANVRGYLYANMMLWPEAEQAFARCAIGAARQQNHYMMSFGLWNMARSLAHRRQCEASALLLAFSQRYWTMNFGALVAGDLRYIKQVCRLIRVQIGVVELERHWARGLQMPLSAALEWAARSLALGPVADAQAG